MNPDTRKGATVVFGCFGFIALCFLLFNAYIGLQFADSMTNLGKTINRKNQKFKYEKLYPARYGERQVAEISEKNFQDEKEFHAKWNKLKPSKFSNQNEKVEIPTEKDMVILENQYDRNCMACLEVHEVIGDNLELKKTVVKTGYFRRMEYQMIGWESGLIDTLFGLPAFTLTNDYFVVNNFNSKDSIADGLLLYKILENETKFVRKIGRDWCSREYFWGYANELYCEAYIIVGGEADFENKKYIRIQNVLK